MGAAAEFDDGEERSQARKKRRTTAQQGGRRPTNCEERDALVARVLVACDHNGDGVLDETEFDRLRTELCEHSPPEAAHLVYVSHKWRKHV